MTCLIGIDVGGTFTDLTVFDTVSGETRAFKALSDRASPDRAVLAALDKSAVARDRIALMMHGTTVATNAFLERRGARTALVTTEGFRDVIELGRTTRLTPNSLYDPYFRRPTPLAARRDRHCLVERTDADGRAQAAPARDALARLIERLEADGIEAVAVGFLNAYANDANERAAVAALREAFEHVCGSADVINEVREYERFSTCVANAYVMPVMARYVARLIGALRAGGYRRPFFTMASHGGLLSDAAVARTPVRTMLSGPAGGLAAACHLMEALEVREFITYDMGGTSTDVALVAGGHWPLRREAVLQGMILAGPQLDIHTIGAGGGSIARVDAGGSLLVGPESAGSSPGPACYGRGGSEPTVTDANVVLGRLGAGQRLGDTLAIDRERALAAMRPVADAKQVSPLEVAEGIVRIANARMAAAIYEVSVARGYDPRDFTLLPYGGAGPLHACELADELGIPRVVLPPVPGAFSAFGTLCAGLLRDRSATVLTLLDEAGVQAFESRYRELEDRLRAEFQADGVDTAGFRAERQVDARYRGQAHELIVGIEPGARATDIRAVFEQAFEREYGRRDHDKPVEIVNLRVLAHVPTPRPRFPAPPAVAPARPAKALRLVRVEGGEVQAPVLDRAQLAAGSTLEGPCVIEEMSATTWVPAGWHGRVGGHGEIELVRAPREPDRGQRSETVRKRRTA